MIDDFGVILAKRSLKSLSAKHRMIQLDEYYSLLEGKTVSGRFSIDWTKIFEGMRTPHKKPDCLDCDKGKICSD